MSLVLWSSWGRGYLRRTTYVDQGPGYGGYPARRGYGRRVIEEEDAPPGPGPGY